MAKKNGQLPLLRSEWLETSTVPHAICDKTFEIRGTYVVIIMSYFHDCNLVPMIVMDAGTHGYN